MYIDRERERERERERQREKETEKREVCVCVLGGMLNEVEPEREKKLRRTV